MRQAAIEGTPPGWSSTCQRSRDKPRGGEKYPHPLPIPMTDIREPQSFNNKSMESNPTRPATSTGPLTLTRVKEETRGEHMVDKHCT